MGLPTKLHFKTTSSSRTHFPIFPHKVQSTSTKWFSTSLPSKLHFQTTSSLGLTFLSFPHLSQSDSQPHHVNCSTANVKTSRTPPNFSFSKYSWYTVTEFTLGHSFYPFPVGLGDHLTYATQIHSHRTHLRPWGRQRKDRTFPHGANIQQ